MNSKVILIVEDERSLRKAASMALTEAGYAVIEAGDGVEGLKLAEEKKPDLILLDHLMPNMDGLTMLEQLRATEWGKQLPVIVMTNMQDVNLINRSLVAGANDTVLKADMTLEKIVHIINERLGVQKTEA